MENWTFADFMTLFLAFYLILRENLDICVRDDLFLVFTRFFGKLDLCGSDDLFFFGLHLISREIGRNTSFFLLFLANRPVSFFIFFSKLPSFFCQ